MSVPDWAPYDDAIKMILRGPVFKHLAPTQNGLLHAMLTVGVRDEAGNRTEKRNLPGIRSKEYFKDEEETESATMYYIPDLFKLMVEICPPWLDGHTLPVDLEYLRNLTGELTSGKEEWALLCRKIEIEHELAELERTNHGGDPLKLESQTRMRTGLKEELLEISTKLQAPHLLADASPESPKQRRERLRNRVIELKTQGVKAFLKTVAEEEGLSVSRIKQLIQVEKPTSKSKAPRW